MGAIAASASLPPSQRSGRQQAFDSRLPTGGHRSDYRHARSAPACDAKPLVSAVPLETLAAR